MKLEPVATVAETHMSRYTLEWTNGPLPEGTPLYAIPDGYVVVPVGPSPFMVECGVMALCADRGPDEYNIQVVYAAMIAAKEQQCNRN